MLVVIEPELSLNVVDQVTDFAQRRARDLRLRRVYTLPQDERAAAFASGAVELFSEFRLDDPLRKALARYPGLTQRVSCVRLTGAPTASDEGADLLSGIQNGTDGPCPAALAIRPHRFIDATATDLIETEIARLWDLCDPAFGYSATQMPKAWSHATYRQSIARLAALWAATLGHRLGRKRWVSRECVQQHFDRMCSVFAVDVAAAEQIVDACMSPSLTYTRLVACAESLPAQHSAHAACSLCGFPTQAWASTAERARVGAAITREFPKWAPEQGICDRCLERFTMMEEGFAYA